MRRYTQSNDYRRYSFLNPSTTQNNYNQLYQPRLDNRSSITYTSSHLLQQYQPMTRISDLAEPLSVFDDFGLSRRCRSNQISRTPIYEPVNADRQVTVHATRFATACAFRERLLIDIQQNITEIDQELSLLERRPIIPQSIPLHYSSMSQRMPSIYYPNRIEPRRPSRIYEVVPRIPNQMRRDISRIPDQPKKVISRIPDPSKKVISHVPNPSKKIIPKVKSMSTQQRSTASVYLVHYHYGPEIEENEINKGDPENIDLQSSVNELIDLNFYEPISLDRFCRVQSGLPENRVSIFIPKSIDAPKVEVNQIEENSHENNIVVPDAPLPALVEESKSFVSAPESKAKIATPSKQTRKKTEDESMKANPTLPQIFTPPIETTPNLNESQLSRQQTIIEPITNQDNPNDDDPPPFNGFGRESINSETHTSAYLDSVLYRTHSTLNADFVDTEDISKLSNTTLLEQKSIDENAKDKAKESKLLKKKKKKKKTSIATPAIASVTTYPSSLPASSVYNHDDDNIPAKDPPE